MGDDSRVKKRENERWAMENERDSTFADMYLHPQEVDYTVDTLMQWVDTVKDLGVEFAGFSNPKLWNVERLLAKDPAVLAKAKALSGGSSGVCVRFWTLTRTRIMSS